jgi:hypothetical protein
VCIIIYKPAEITLFPETIKNAFLNNPDGGGFSYLEDGKLTISKGFWTSDAFLEAYTPHEKKQAVLHFRIKTHGSYAETNCHPFYVSPNLIFAHNGVLYKMPNHIEKSDTVLFNELVLQNIVRIYGKRILFDPSFKSLLEGYASGSKFVFMDHIGKVSIINEKDGEWNSKCWFSNHSYQPKKSYSYTPPDHTTRHKKTKHLPQLPAPRDQLSLIPTYTQSGTVQYSDRPWTIGDYLRPTIPCGLIDKGWLGRAMSFYQNGDVEVFFPIRQMSKRIPVIYLERVVPQEIKVEE